MVEEIKMIEMPNGIITSKFKKHEKEYKGYQSENQLEDELIKTFLKNKLYRNGINWHF